jgi:hypothetical protein
MTRCAQVPARGRPMGSPLLRSDPFAPAGAGQRSFGAGSCAQRVMPEPITASHLLIELLDIPLSQQAGKWLVIPRTAGCASNVSEVGL